MLSIKNPPPTSTLDRSISIVAAQTRLQELTHRHLFLRSIITAIGNLQYGFLLPANLSLTEMGKLNTISILIDKGEIDDWETILRSSPYIERFSQRNRTHYSQFEIRFRDGSELLLQTFSRLQVKHFQFLPSQEVLDNVFINRDGLKVCQMIYAFEFLWLCANIKQLEFSKALRPYFLARSPQEQIQIADYICNKYRIPSNKLLNLIIRSPQHRHFIMKKVQVRAGTNNRNGFLGFSSLFAFFQLAT